jgi:hypothetical protein
MDEVSSQGTWFRFSRTMLQRLFHLLLLIPSCGGPGADLGEKREPRETACNSFVGAEISDEGELDTPPPR